jgi:hypothetical protein
MTHPDAPSAEPASPRAAQRAAMLAYAAEVQMRSLKSLDAELAAVVEAPRDESRVDKLERLAGSVEKAARGLRLTLAMEERSELDHEVRVRRALAEAEKKAAARAEELCGRKRAHLGFALERAIETAEDPYANSKVKDRLNRVERLVERESIERDRFLDRPMRETLARLCAELGVKVRPDVWREADWVEVDPVEGNQDAGTGDDAIGGSPEPPPPPPKPRRPATPAGPVRDWLGTTLPGLLRDRYAIPASRAPP